MNAPGQLATAALQPCRPPGPWLPAGASPRGRDAFPRAQLRLALQEQRLRAAYQTLFRLHDQQPVGQEALARLLTPQGRVVDAQAFIDTAAAIGLEPRIDAVITAQAMAAAPVLGKMFLNCSSAFLAEPSCVERLRQQHLLWRQKQHGRATRHTPWVLEITERNLHTDPSRLRDKLQPLLDLGFELALDDFGSNHSAYPYLAALPIRYLKLDRSLVQSSMTAPRSEAILRHLLRLAQDIDLITVAEGVEDTPTLHWLRDLGVHWGQGFIWTRPGDRPAAPCPAPALVTHSAP